MYIRNSWYVGAWDYEVGRKMIRRTLLEEPILFYRRQDGIPVAIEDRCIHRGAPLSKGNLIGDIVQCPYHGIQFNQFGEVVCIPSQPQIPKEARIRAYPIIEKYHWIWVWMGDPELADPNLIEDFHWMEDPDWGFGGDRFYLEANYLLLVENLMDTTHLTFVHPTTLGTDDFAASECTTEKKEKKITVTRWLMDRPPAPFHQQMGEFPEGTNVDRWQITTFSPPAFVKLDVGSAIAGTGARENNRKHGMNMMNLNAITPETQTSTHYFWAQAFNFRTDQPWISNLVRQQVSRAFSEDLVIIKAQQENINEGSQQTFNLQQDAGGMAAKSIIEKLVALENSI